MHTLVEMLTIAAFLTSILGLVKYKEWTPVAVLLLAIIELLRIFA
jgi:hypothetical protein